MQIVGLKIQNTFNIKAMDLEFRQDGEAIVLRGNNGAGKSAVMDTIWYGLTGKKPAKPIREGQKKSEITVDLGERSSYEYRIFLRKEISDENREQS